MNRALIFTMDDVNYKGGAHFTTLDQVEFLYHNLGRQIKIISFKKPEAAITQRFSYVRFIRLRRPEHWHDQVKGLGEHVEASDIVCVPFENSWFRHSVAKLDNALKIQWIPTDYDKWRKASKLTESFSEDDGVLYRSFDRVVFVSKRSMDGFISLYPDLRDKCSVCGSRFDSSKIYNRSLEEVHVSQGFSGKRERLKLITVARLENAAKGIDRSLRVADKLLKAGYDFEWMFVGKGEPSEEKYLNEYAVELGLQNNVIWREHVENPYPLMRAADIFCLFSIYEGMPITLIESLITGTPVIATDVGIVSEVLPGWGWVTENDEESIFQGLKALLERPENLSQARAALRDYKYDNAGIEKTIEAIYDATPVPVIPKIIHYCWFGGKVKSDTIEMCIASWRKCLPDYEIIEWNEDNCDIAGNEFAKTAYAAEKWAFVADYFRFKVLYEHGGIYMDTDMFLHKSLDDFLVYNAFWGIESFACVNACITGAVAGNAIVKRILDTYAAGAYSPDGGTICDRITDVLQKHCTLEFTGNTQFLKGNIAVFAPNILTINVSDGECVAEHLYEASWVDVKHKAGASYRHEVLKHYFTNPHLEAEPFSSKHLNPHLKNLLKNYGAAKLIRRLVKIKLHEVWKSFFKKFRKPAR